jgi:hypothetical protein
MTGSGVSAAALAPAARSRRLATALNRMWLINLVIVLT